MCVNTYSKNTSFNKFDWVWSWFVSLCSSVKNTLPLDVVHPCFSFFRDTAYLGEEAKLVDNIDDLNDCLDHCMKQPDCYGIDFSPNVSSNLRYVFPKHIRKPFCSQVLKQLRFDVIYIKTKWHLFPDVIRIIFIFRLESWCMSLQIMLLVGFSNATSPAESSNQTQVEGGG